MPWRVLGELRFILMMVPNLDRWGKPRPCYVPGGASVAAFARGGRLGYADPGMRPVSLVLALSLVLPVAAAPTRPELEALARHLAEQGVPPPEAPGLAPPPTSWLAETATPEALAEATLDLERIRIFRALGFPEEVLRRIARDRPALSAGAQRELRGHRLWALATQAHHAEDGRALVEASRGDVEEADLGPLMQILYGEPGRWGEELYDQELKLHAARRDVAPVEFMGALSSWAWQIGLMHPTPFYKVAGFFAHVFRQIDELEGALGAGEALRHRQTATLYLAMALAQEPERGAEAAWCFERALALARGSGTDLWVTYQWSGDFFERRTELERAAWMRRGALAVTRRTHDFGNFATGDRTRLGDLLRRLGSPDEAAVLFAEARRIADREAAAAR